MTFRSRCQHAGEARKRLLLWFDHRTPHVLGEPAAPLSGGLARPHTHWFVRAVSITLVIGFVIVRYAVRRYARGELSTSAPLARPSPNWTHSRSSACGSSPTAPNFSTCSSTGTLIEGVAGWGATAWLAAGQMSP